MKILYDYQIFEAQQFGGISRYFFELMNHFSTNNILEWECPVIYSNNEYIRQLPVLYTSILPMSSKKNPIDDFLRGRSFRGKRVLYKLKTAIIPETLQPDNRQINKANAIEKIKSKNYDILHPTYYDEYILDYIDDKPYVLTVYDMINQVFPEFFYKDPSDKTRRLVQLANKVIAISHSTKSDIVNIFGIPEEKVAVVHLASSLITKDSQLESEFKISLPKNYFLFVGLRGGYKNFMFFAQMFAALAIQHNDIHIVCTGSPLKVLERSFLQDLGIADRVTQVFVQDTQLFHLYQNAIALVFASMYEGFGLPILEAFSAGCLVIASKTSSLEEIGNDAVIYFEPKNPDSLLRALKQALYNKDLCKDKISKGYARLGNFSWQKTAIETKKVYESVLKS